jgi:hypothetical protein
MRACNGGVTGFGENLADTVSSDTVTEGRVNLIGVDGQEFDITVRAGADELHLLDRDPGTAGRGENFNG